MHHHKPFSHVLQGYLLSILFLLSLSLGGCHGNDSREQRDYRIEPNVSMAMRDGVVLRADLWMPRLGSRFPVLIFRTPYSKNEGDPDNERTFEAAVKRGYAVLVQDVRGRYASDGAYEPYRQEREDGYDTVEWAASQPWSDGRVGMFGLSYPGGVQWLAAVTTPPHLKAIVPAMCFSTLNQFIYYGGVLDVGWIEWIYKCMSADARVRLDLPGPRTDAEAARVWNEEHLIDWLSYLPLMDLPYLREVAPYYYDWVKNDPYTAYWEYGDLRSQYDQVDAAVLNLSGWHDEPYGAEGAVTNFLGVSQSRGPYVDPATHLILGPWEHGVGAVREGRAGELTFPAAALDYDDLVLDWLDCHVRDVGCEDISSMPVHYFVMGAGQWLTADTWPPDEAEPVSYYFASRQELSRQAPAEPQSFSFVANPKDPVEDKFGANFGAYDLRYLAEREDVLTFDTPPLASDLKIGGDIRVEISVQSTAPDFDICVLLLDVYPDGRAYNLVSPGAGLQRISYRDPQKGKQLLQPGEVVRLRLGNLRTANLFREGHRIRLAIFASWSPYYARNLQNGQDERYSAEMSSAEIRVVQQSDQLARLILPVLPE